MKVLIRSSLALLVLIFVLGCVESFVQNSYKTLSVSKEAYSSTLSIAGSLYKQGLMTEAQKDEAIKYGNLYMQVHNESVAALLNYKTSGLASDKDIYLNLMADVAIRLANLTNYLKPFILKEVN